jgi:hypothetical protein
MQISNITFTCHEAIPIWPVSTDKLMWCLGCIVHNLCRKKYRSSCPCPEHIRLRAFRLRIILQLHPLLGRMLMLALLSFGPYLMHYRHKYLLHELASGQENILHEIFLGEKGAAMCHWQRAQKCTGWFKAISFSDAATKHIWAVLDPRNGQWQWMGHVVYVTVNPK